MKHFSFLLALLLVGLGSLSAQAQQSAFVPFSRIKAAVDQVAEQTPNYHSRNCVEFLYAVLQELCPDSADQALKHDVYIFTLDGKPLNRHTLDTDERVKGIQYALTKRGWGKAIPRDQVRPGDFVQYWYSAPAPYKGHSGVVVGVNEDGTLELFGSNRSTGGPGHLHNMKLRQYAYFVRLKKGACH